MLSTRISPTSTCELTDEELAARSQQGDALALDQLLRRYRRFARSKARSYYLVGADADDIEQEGLIGLYKAARDFRPDRQTSFRGFAEVCVTRQVISAVKAATRHKHRPLNQYVSFSAPRRDDADDRSFEDTLDDRRNLDPADEVISREQIVAIRRSMHESLSGLEVDVLRLYIEGKSYQEIGLYLGRHTKSIDNALQRIKRKLDQHVTETPEDGTPAKLALAS
jgi:RNA polymerase sporulation-specific sigma factor